MLRVPSLLLVTSIALFAFGTTDALAGTCKSCDLSKCSCINTQGPNPTCQCDPDPVCNDNSSGTGNCQFKQNSDSGQGNTGNKTCTCTTNKQKTVCTVDGVVIGSSCP
jgi:hypothetical protein